MRHVLTITALCLLISLTTSAQEPAPSPMSGASSDGGRLNSLDKTPACTIFQGQPNSIPLWVNALAIGSSVMYQDPNTKFIGVGTSHPGATLDVNGNANAAVYQIGGGNVLGIGKPVNANLFAGLSAGANDIPDQGITNTFVGSLAGQANDVGSDNTFVGSRCGNANTGGMKNTFIGSSAGLANNTGSHNVFMGAQAGAGNTTGSGNTFTGYASGINNTEGEGNTLYGFESGTHATGSYNTFVGYQTGFNNVSGSWNIYIANQSPGTQTESNTIRIGDQNQTSAFISGIYGVNTGGLPVMINSSGQLSAPTSSRRFKENVRDMGDSSTGLMKLRPVTFRYKAEYDRGPRLLQYGLIAEEVAKVYPELVAYDDDGQPYSVRYQYLSAMLLNEAQKQYRRAEVQAEVIVAQQKKIEALEQRLSWLEAKIKGKVELASSAR
jgi:hypothetical protein